MNPNSQDRIDAPVAIAALTQGAHIPSTRFRVLQHLDRLKRDGILVEHLTARFGSYPPPSRLYRPAWLVAALADAVRRALKSNRFQACLLQRELVSTLDSAEPLIRRPVIFDVDDAIFSGRRGWMSDRMARRAAVTICGNNFLADHYARFGAVTVLPTAVDTQRFVPAPAQAKQVIGWSGSSSGFPYLYSIEDALRIVLDRHPEATLEIVADRKPQFDRIKPERIRFLQWTADSEVKAIQGFTVGLMPLHDTVWARGKCSFKMLTYMAVGIPVVVSPVGMNAEVLSLGECGYAAMTADDWVEAISTLLVDAGEASVMGQTGRRVTVEHFSQEVIAPRLGHLLRTVANGRGCQEDAR